MMDFARLRLTFSEGTIAASDAMTLKRLIPINMTNTTKWSSLDLDVHVQEKDVTELPFLNQPTTRCERISNIDVLRGFALLGILMLNVQDFGTPEFAHDIPIGMPKPAFIGPHAHLHLLLVTLTWVFFEGKMRALFSMLFGAGILLMTSRAERRGASSQIADIYLRRNMWLTFFGFLHGCLIWDGDILFLYGLAGLLFMYPLRKLKARTLLFSGTVISLFFATYGLFCYLGATNDFSLAGQATAIAADKQAGRTLTPEQKAIEQQWNVRVDHNRITPARTAEAMKHAHANYMSSAQERLQTYIGPRAPLRIGAFLLEGVGAMLIGMGLYKTGFLIGDSSYTVYAWTAVIGFTSSAPLYIYGMLKASAQGFFFLDIEKWLYLPYYFTREAGAVAIAAVVMMIVKSGILRPLQTACAAVGQTALSNYLLTSILCQFLFIWGPWKLYGKLEYYQLLYVVIGVWALNLTVSQIWLQWCAFGPFEWLWRSLTYMKAQPILR